MGSPYLNTNESIVLSTHNLAINTIPAEAILTNQRLIIVDTLHPKLRPQDIPFSSIETVTIGDNSDMDPVLSLSIVLAGDERQTLGITFAKQQKAKRAGERDTWAVKLKELSVGARREGGAKPAELHPPWVPGALPEEEAGPAPMAGEKFTNPPIPPRKGKVKAAPQVKNRAILAAGIVVLILIIAAAGLFLLSPGLTGKPGPQAPAATPTATATESPTPTPSPATEPAPAPVTETTAAPTPEAPAGPPGNGVWLQVTYPGKYDGSYGASGRMTTTSGSGTQFFQVAAKDEIVQATFTKLDDSGNQLTVSLYNGGQLVGSDSTSHPHDTVDLHVDLRKAPAAAATTGP